MRILPFPAERPPPDLAAAVASLPYDVVDTAQARTLAAGNPYSFLRIVRPEVDLPEDTPAYADEVYARGAANLHAFRAQGILRRDDRPSLYAYRLTAGGHAQTGLVATCHIDDYLENVIRKHERTLPAKEEDRTRHVDTLDANTGPVFLTYRGRPDIDARMADVEAGPPLYDFTAVDGVRHTAWRIEDANPWVDAFTNVPAAYVADGHHRAASAVRVGRRRRAANPQSRGNEPYNYFLSVLFPADQLRILPYNRLVTDLQGRSAEAFLQVLRESGAHIAAGDGARVDTPGVIALYLPGSWYRLSWPDKPPPDPVAALDVSLLQERVLGPWLGIDNPGTSDRIRFVGGIHGTHALTQPVDAGECAVAFSLCATRLDQLMQIADAGRIMPAKSTWFEPKLRSGLFVYSLEAPGHDSGGA
jgi:uncharacterized protein (DUF1015 family)